MKRLLIAATLVLSACTTAQKLETAAAIADTVAPPPPAPLAKTVIDETALDAAWRSFDLALDAINLYVDLKPGFVGSPKAIALADGIQKVKAALLAAEAAANAGEATSYKKALDEAKVALANLRVVLGSK